MSPKKEGRVSTFVQDGEGVSHQKKMLCFFLLYVSMDYKKKNLHNKSGGGGISRKRRVPTLVQERDGVYPEEGGFLPWCKRGRECPIEKKKCNNFFWFLPRCFRGWPSLAHLNSKGGSPACTMQVAWAIMPANVFTDTCRGANTGGTAKNSTPVP